MRTKCSGSYEALAPLMQRSPPLIWTTMSRNSASMTSSGGTTVDSPQSEHPPDPGEPVTLRTCSVSGKGPIPACEHQIEQLFCLRTKVPLYRTYNSLGGTKADSEYKATHTDPNSLLLIQSRQEVNTHSPHSSRSESESSTSAASWSCITPFLA